MSSMQIDNPERGFTYKYEGPLDLRLNPEKGISAAESGKTTGRTKFTEKQWLFRSLPEMVKTPREAYFAEKEAVPFAEAEGRIAAEMAAPYPPGIPLICPGERYSREMLELMRQYKSRRLRISRTSDASLEVLYVLKEE